jgi:hypothetical protein
MKKLIAIIILSLLCYSAEARNLMVVGGGVPVAGGGGPDVYYGPSSTTASGWLQPYPRGSAITISQGGTITKLRVYIAEKDETATAVKIALYNSNASTLLSSGGTISSFAVPGWHEITLGSGVAVNTSDVVVVLCMHNADGIKYGNSTAAGGYWVEGGVTYAAFPAASYSLSSDDEGRLWSVQVYVD